jgi:hydrogenase/urease accessory protein HupE
MKLSRLVAVLVAGACGIHLAAAHPGHAATDLVSQVTQPFAGPDHLLAFVSLSTLLLLLLAALCRARVHRHESAPQPHAVKANRRGIRRRQ